MDIRLIFKHFKSITDMIKALRTNEDCIKFLEEIIWEGVPVSPFDKSSKVYKCRDGWYKCKNTGKEFTVLTGTIFYGTKIDLLLWFIVTYRDISSKCSVASTTIARDYGITQTTAWHMLSKIRQAMGKENHQHLEGVVEVDEYYEGGALKNMHLDKWIIAKNKEHNNKKLLQGFVERRGNAVINIIPNREESTLNAGILRYVKPGSTVYTDDYRGYNKVPPLYTRGTVVHSKKHYVSKENKSIHTNTIESVWATFSRTIMTHVHVSDKHLQNYANECVFRYNTRKMETKDAFIWFLQNIGDTHITWRQIRNGEYRQYNRNQARTA